MISMGLKDIKNWNLELEKETTEKWKKAEMFRFNEKTKKKIYSIDTPPPYVNAPVHIGQAVTYCYMDFFARYRRMKGYEVIFPLGLDRNGLPIEIAAEKKFGISAFNTPREKFLDYCKKLLNETSSETEDTFAKLGISFTSYKRGNHFGSVYLTDSEEYRTLTQATFIDLYKTGEVYKAEFPTIWCPECQTPVAQAELEDKEFDSVFSTLKFSCSGKDLLIATTRPELLQACVGVFVNPKDKRYQNIIGKKAKVPIFNHEVPILEDESADLEKGTGVLMVCSYGDKFDVDAIQRHKLKPRIIFNKDGTTKEGAYKNLSIKEARKKILQDLRDKNLITDRKEISHVVNVHDKCGCGIEFLPTEQWFIKVLDKKRKLIEQGKKVNWHPKYMFKRYENWIKGLEWDWSISRERHFGVSIPVWYCRKCGEVILADEKELPVDPLNVKKKCPKCKEEAIPEKKVLDTWATSSLTPQLASSLIKNKIEIPFSLRPQAHDIIRTWAFYTIVKSLLHEKEIPWSDIAISGFVTLKGEKMSKSKGNVIAPQDVLENYGADALRFWAAGSKLGEDLDYQEKDLVTGTKMVTKLWNASNFVFMNLPKKIIKPNKLEKVDELFLQKLNDVIKKTTLGFEEYEYSKAKSEVERFFWNVFCDYYLEIVKWRVYNGSKLEKESAYFTLYNILLNILKMISPIMPFITEEIFKEHYKKENSRSIHLCEWPNEFKVSKEKSDEKIFEKLIEIIGKIRQEKTKAQKSMKAEIKLSLSKKEMVLLKPVLEDLKHVVNAREIREGKFGVEFVG